MKEQIWQKMLDAKFKAIYVKHFTEKVKAIKLFLSFISVIITVICVAVWAATEAWLGVWIVVIFLAQIFDFAPPETSDLPGIDNQLSPNYFNLD